jgi:hypothetical protein
MNWPRSGPAAAPTRAATVTGAQPGVVTVRTGRGLASVPAWRFTVAGLGWKVSEVAVARDALVVLPGYVHTGVRVREIDDDEGSRLRRIGRCRSAPSPWSSADTGGRSARHRAGSAAVRLG